MKSAELTVIRNIFRVLRGIHVHPALLLAPILLSLAASVFEGASMGLLIPLLNGFLQQDFSFIKEAPYIGTVINSLPANILSSDKLLFVTLLTIFIFAVLLKNVLKLLSGMSMSYFSERSLHHLRKTLFGRYLSFGKLFFDRSSIGHHSTVLAEFTRSSIAPLLLINQYIHAFFSFAVYLVVMFMISWELTIFALPLFAILHFSVRRIVRRVRMLSKAIAQRGTMLGKKSIEILSTIPLVKSYSTERQEKDYYVEISNEKARLDFHTVALQQMMLPLQETITLLSAVLLFGCMLYLMVNDQSVAPTTFIVYFYLVINASSKFGTVTSFRGALAFASGPLDEVIEVLDDKQEKYIVPSGSQQFSSLGQGISFRNITFAYPDGRTVLKDTSFSMDKGKMTAIVGPTGAGKTTLISLIMRFYDCPPGSIFVDDTDIRDFAIPSFLSRVALVSQETLLLHDTLRNNITYGLTDVSDEDFEHAIDRARLREFVDVLSQGSESLIGDRGVKLSGGEKQRVSIARALLKGAEVLILDEATSSLDTRTERLIQEAIDEAIKGRTAIVIAHRLSTIKHADKIIVIDNGCCVEEGSLEELLSKKGKFYELWEEQKFS